MAAVKQRSADDATLVREAQAGKQRSFATLVKKYHGMVYAIAFARLANKGAAQDLTQEVFLRVYLNLEHLEEPRYFSAWISTIARNLATKWAAKDQRTSRIVSSAPLENVLHEIPDTTGETIREKMMVEEEQSTIQKAIMRLAPELREMVLLHYMEDWSKRDIAKRLGVHPATVGRQLEKALGSLKKHLEPILRENAIAFRPPRKSVARTIAIVSATATMSVSSKSALAATAGGIAQLSAGMTTKTGVISYILGSLSSVATTGGVIVGTKKAIVIGVIAITAITGGTYTVTKVNENRAEQARKERLKRYFDWEIKIGKEQYKYVMEHPEILTDETDRLVTLLKNGDYDYYDPETDQWTGHWSKVHPLAGKYTVEKWWDVFAKWCAENLRDNPIQLVTYGKVHMGNSPRYGLLPSVPYEITLRDGRVLEDTLHFLYIQRDLGVEKSERPLDYKPEEWIWWPVQGFDWHLKYGDDTSSENDDLNTLVAKLDIDTANLEDVIEIFGEPVEYMWSGGSFDRDNLPDTYLARYPNGFRVLIKKNQIRELRFENDDPDYRFDGGIRVGSSLDDVIGILGQPTETIVGEPCKYKDGVLYKDFDGKKGLCYYRRSDRNVRMFFVDYLVSALYVTRSDF